MKAEESQVKSQAKKTIPVNIPELVTFLEAGVHFGHERRKKNPKMDQYIYMMRNRMAIIDLEKTKIALTKAVDFIYDIAKDPNKEILFVGTKRQTRAITKRYAMAAKMPYVTQRWVGGMLTNFSTVLKSIEKLEELTNASEQGLSKLTKKERSVHTKEIERLSKVLEGTKSLRKPPAVIFAIGSHDEKLAVREANRVGIPVVAITDTNANPDLVQYPIPANDDAIRSIDLIVNTITQAILSAHNQKLNLPVIEVSDIVAEKIISDKNNETGLVEDKPKDADGKEKTKKAKKTLKK